MTIVISQTDIVNKAQILLGSTERLGQIDDGGTLASTYRTLWKIAVRSALEAYPWNFAITRQELLRDTVAPAFGWAARFRLPADCVRWLPWARGDALHFEGEEEGGYILCDQEDYLPIRYVRFTDDMGLWTPLFGDALAYTLAMERCEGATTLRGLYRDLADARDEIHMMARRADGMKTGQRQRGNLPAQSRWGGARFRPTGVGPR